MYWTDTAIPSSELTQCKIHFLTRRNLRFVVSQGPFCSVSFPPFRRSFWIR